MSSPAPASGIPTARSAAMAEPGASAARTTSRLASLLRPGGGLARDAGLNMAGAVINAAFTFALFWVLARRTSEANLGAFVVGIAGFTIASTTAQFGANVGLVRTIPRLREAGRRREIGRVLGVALGPEAVVGVILGLGLFALASVLAELLGQGADTGLAVEYLQAMALFVPFGALFLTMAQASQGFGTMIPAVAVDKVGRSTVHLIAVGLAIVVGTTAASLAWTLPYVAGVALFAWWLWRLWLAVPEADPGAALPSRSAVASEFWSFSSPRGVAAACQVTILWLDAILLAFISGTTDAGIYSVATRYLVVGHLVIGALLQATAPRLSGFLARDDLPSARALYQRTASWVVAVVWPAYIVIAIFAPWLLGLFGESYVEGTTALRIVAVAMMVAAASGAVDMVLLMSGRSRLSLFNWGGALALNVVLNLILIPRYGIEGAAIAWAGSILFRNVIPVFEVRALMGMHPFSWAYNRLLPASLVIVGGASLLGVGVVGEASLASLLAGAVPGGLIYAGLLWRWRFRLLEGSSGPKRSPGVEVGQ